MELILPHRTQAFRAAPVSAPLGDIVSSCCADLDATIAASFTSGQTWKNYEPTPSDGSAQTDYDFFLGIDGSSSTDDPTFTGSAGDSGAFFAHDGGDFFTIAGGNTQLIKDVQKTTGGSTVTFGFAFSTPSDFLGTNVFFFGTEAGGNSHGFRMWITPDIFRWVQSDASGSDTVIFAADPTILVSTDYLLLLSIDHTAGTLKYWLNSTTGISETPVQSATTTDAVNAFQLGAVESTVQLINGYETKGFYIFDEIFDDTKAALVFAHLETRHALDYTP